VRRTKIIATLGPATSSEEKIEALIRVGVDVTRFNFSHGDHQMHLKNAEIVRSAAKEQGRNVAIMQDLQGPKIRTGEVEEGTELVEGNRVIIASGGLRRGREPALHNLRPPRRGREARRPAPD
jgi:pyruvate kinase